MEIREPQVVTDGGPWAEHDMPCGVCQRRHAVLDLNVGHYLPCWECQRDGYMLVRAQGRLASRIVKTLADTSRWRRSLSWWQD